jgi:hypothetical protein
MGTENGIIHQKVARAMIIQDPRIKVKCPECGRENVQSKLSFATIVA